MQRPRREAAGDRDCGLRRHVRHERVLARRRHLAEDEERAVALDLDSHMWFADEARAQSLGDRRRKRAGEL